MNGPFQLNPGVTLCNLNFAVKNDRAIVEAHRLLACGKIDDGKSLMKKTQMVLRQQTFFIGSPVLNGRSHLRKKTAIDFLPIFIYDSYKATHGLRFMVLSRINCGR